MSKQNEYIFVLWGNRFDEMTATTFVTGLRQAGLLVKVVGLTPPPIRGANGLALHPDLMLGEALLLAGQVRGVVIPALARDVEPFKSDPRLKYFLYRICTNQVRLVIKGDNRTNVAAYELFPAIDHLAIYMEGEDLGEFTARLSRWFRGQPELRIEMLR